MRKTNSFSGFGFLFMSGTALVSPVHEWVTREALYRATAAPGRRPFWRRPIAHLTGALERLRQRQEQRRSLAMLDDRLLRDIGLTRADVENQLRQPFWR